jgi:signal transduction histidine kinase
MSVLNNRQPLDGLTIRTALLLAFGVTLGLWLFSGYSFTRRMADVQSQAAAINGRYMRAQELLSAVRAQVLLGSVYVRDALLDPNPGATAEYRRQLDDTFRITADSLQQYVPVLDSPEERQHVQQLRDEIARFRLTLLDVLASDSTRWPAEARLLLRSRIMPRREEVIRVSEDIQALNRSAFVQQQTATTEVYRATQRRIWTQFGIALAASFAIGLFATRHVARLEDRIRSQQAKDAENTRDLQRLSAQIITAQEEERRVIARELHDEVGQVLTAIKVELAFAQRAIDGIGGSSQLLAEARSITERALHTVRDLSQLLHPALLDDLGLPAALDFYLTDVGKRHGIRVDLLQDRMAERLTPQVEAAAYRIVQEAVTNIVKHARATACRVYLQRLLNTVLITIEDDGMGFDTSEVQRAGARAGLGLLGIRERATQLRGTVRLESSRGRGTRLTIELPAHPRLAPAAGEQTDRELSGTGTVDA